MTSFTEFWQAYPRRKGANPIGPAQEKYNMLVKQGVKPENLVYAARAYAEELKQHGQFASEFVCMARTWLHQKRFLDYVDDDPDGNKQAKMDAYMASKGYIWDGKQWVNIGRQQHDHP